MRARTAIVACAFALGACLPSRDNSVDPSIAPNAHLVVVDDGLLGASECETPLTPAQVSAASRGHCLSLDARGTTDPTGAALSSLSFEFFFVGTNGIPAAAPTKLASSATNGVVAFTRDDLLKYPVGPELDFAVTVSRGRFRGLGHASLVLLDDPPVAVAMPPIHLPLGGYAWNPGAPMPITLDASRSSDPEGDKMSFRWTVDGVGTVVTTNAKATLSIPATPARRYLVTLEAIDAPPASRVSRPSFADVRVGAPPVWNVPYSYAYGPAPAADDLFERLDPTTAPVTEGRPQQVLTAGVDSAGAPIILAALDVPTAQPSVVVRDAAIYEADSFALRFQSGVPENTIPVWAADPPRRRFFRIDAYTQAVSIVRVGSSNLDVVATLRPGIADVVTGRSFSGGEGVGPGELAPAVDAGGNLWAAWIGTDGSAFVGALHDDGAFVQRDPVLAGSSVRGLGIRADGSGEVWTSETALVAGAPVGEVTVHRIGADPVTLPILVGSGPVRGFTWIDESFFWVDLPSVGLVQVDADLAIAAGAVTPAAVVTTVPGIRSGCAAFDAYTRDCWASGLSSTLRVGSDGHVREFAGNYPLGVSADGSVWYAVGTAELWHGEVPDPSGVAESLRVIPGEAQVDVPTGGLWLAGSASRELVHLAVDGSILSDQFERQDPSHARSELPILWPWKPLPDGSAAWGGDFTNGLASVSIYDLTTDPPTVGAQPVLDQNEALDAHGTIVPAGPIPSSTPFAWIAGGTAPAMISLVTPGSAPSTIFTTPAYDATALRAAGSLRTNFLCLQTAYAPSTGNVMVESWYVDPNGAPESARRLMGAGYSMSSFFTAGASLLGVAVSPKTPGGTTDLCWSAWGVPNPPASGPPYPPACPTGTSTLVALDPARPPGPPPIYHLFSESDGLIQSIDPIDGDHVWITRVRCNAQNEYEYVRTRLVWNAANNAFDAFDTVQSHQTRLSSGESSN